VNEIVLMHEPRGGKKLYNIPMEMDGTKFLFEDIIVTEKVEKGDKIEICYNPGCNGIVSKVNEVKTSKYKYHYEGRGKTTVYDIVMVFMTFVIFLVFTY